MSKDKKLIGQLSPEELFLEEQRLADYAGEDRIVSIDDDTSPSGVQHRYVLARTGVAAYQATLNIEFFDASGKKPLNSAYLQKLESCLPMINQRLIGPFGFTHIWRSFDGIHYSHNQPKGNFTFVGAIPTRGVFQTDGWGQTDSAFGYAAYTKPWGKGTHSADTRVFALHYYTPCV